MGLLDELHRQVQAASGIELPPGDAEIMSGHVRAIVDAVSGIELVVAKQDMPDYAPALKALTEGLKSALSDHGGALVKAVKGIEVKVEAPRVTVKAPEVTVNPEFEVTLPDPLKLAFDIQRDENGQMSRIITTEYVPEKPKEMAMELE